MANAPEGGLDAFAPGPDLGERVGENLRAQLLALPGGEHAFEEVEQLALDLADGLEAEGAGVSQEPLGDGVALQRGADDEGVHGQKGDGLHKWFLPVCRPRLGAEAAGAVGSLFNGSLVGAVSGRIISVKGGGRQLRKDLNQGMQDGRQTPNLFKVRKRK